MTNDDETYHVKLTEAEVLARYSTPGLRKGELGRSAKKLHLEESHKHLSKEEREKILSDLYPEDT